jgi:hypothetical protein
MQDNIIQTREDSAPFGAETWSIVLFWCGLIAIYAFPAISGTVHAIWEEVLSGDYKRAHMIASIAVSVVVLPLLLAFCTVLLLGPWLLCEKSATTVDRGRRELVLTRRSILGIRRTRRVALDDIHAIVPTSNVDEEGVWTHALTALLPKGRQLHLTSTQTDLAEITRLADDLQTTLRATGWTPAAARGASDSHPQETSA